MLTRVTLILTCVAVAALSVPSQSSAQIPKPPREVTNRLGMEFVLIADPGGGFYMGRTEVTLAQFRQYSQAHANGSTQWNRSLDQKDLPAVSVSFAQAKAFCAWLGKEDGGEYRLPPEAEWEQACRAGRTGKYFFGDDRFDLKDYAWYDDNAGGLGVRDEDKGPRPVGQKLPNNLGLFDMLGNVWEWCDGSSGPVARGGGWNTAAPDCICTAARKPDVRGDAYTGFRVIMVKPPQGRPRGTARWSEVGQKALQELMKAKGISEALADKAVIAVVPLSSQGKGTTQLGIMLASGIESALLESGRFRVADRRTLDQVLNEKDIALALAQDHIAELAKALSVEALLTGSVTITGEHVVCEVRLVGVKKAEVLATATFNLPTDEEIRSLMLYVQRPTEKAGQQAGLPPLMLYYDVLAQRETTKGQYEEVLVREGSALRSGDQYRIRVQASSDCYLYLVTYDSKGDVYVLFPHGQIRQGGFIRGGVTYTIPGDQDPWYTLDENIGAETLVFIASYEPLADLDKLVAQMHSAGASGEAAKAVKQEIDRLDKAPGQAISGGYRISGERGTVLARPKAQYDLTSGRKVANVMSVAEGSSRVVKAVSFKHN